MFNKKGFSDVIRNSLIALILFVAIIIVFIILYNLVYSETELQNLPELSMNIIKDSVKINNQDVSMNVKYNEGSTNLEKMRFVIYDGINSEIVDISASDLKATKEKTFQFSLKQLKNNKVNINTANNKTIRKRKSPECC